MHFFMLGAFLWHKFLWEESFENVLCFYIFGTMLSLQERKEPINLI